jgi:hypothetical protein
MRTFTSAGRRRRPSGMICGRAWVGTLGWPFLRDGSANVWWNGTCLAPERTGFAALSSCGGREVRGGQPDLGSCARGSGAGRVVHLWLPRRAGRGGSAATPPPVPAGSADRVCIPSACISLSRLAHSIDTQLKGNVVGYVALIGTSQAVSSGLARTAADPPELAMGPNVMVNVATSARCSRRLLS